MDVYVCASNSETAPLSLLETMASGRAIVTTDCGGPSEIIRDGWSGFVVPIRDSGAIAAKIALLLNDASLRRTFGQNAEQESNKYDIRATVARLESLYQKATSHSRIVETSTMRSTEKV
jgi:glycosyltransferase involved in cell wall biosynthesis